MISHSLFPQNITLDAFIELFMALLQLPSHFLHAALQSFLYLLATAIQRINYFVLTQNSILLLHDHQLRYPLHCLNVIVIFGNI